MDIPLKTFILLTLCVLVNSASSDPSLEQDLTSPNASLIHKVIILNFTICVPPSVTDNTKIVSFNFNEVSKSTLEFTVQAQRNATNALCKDTKDPCKTSPEEPELTVMVFKQAILKKVLVCSANITDESLRAIIDTEGREIVVHPKKTKGVQNFAKVTLHLVASTINSIKVSKTSPSEVVVLATVFEPLVPTTTIASSTVTTKASTTSETTTLIKDETSHTPESTETTEFHSSPVTVFHSSKGSSLRPESTTLTPTSMGESNLCCGPLSGLILLVLLPVLLYN